MLSASGRVDAAPWWVRAKAARYGINAKFYEKPTCTYTCQRAPLRRTNRGRRDG